MTAAPAPLLFPSLLGDGFDELPSRVRALHLREGRQHLSGEVEVERGSGWLSRACAWATRLPPAGSGPIGVEIVAVPGGERWTRSIAGHVMASRLWSRDGLLREKLGLVTFAFQLSVEDAAIVWRATGAWVFGLPLPAAWLEGVAACESQRDGRYHFDVFATLPRVGLLVRYRGWLHVP